MQKWFLKCFYGYRNWWDELLFRGVIDYIATHYPEIEHLDVEVADVTWMQSWREINKGSMWVSAIATPFVTGVRHISFIPLSRDIGDNFRYDKYFFGGGELFAESRWFHGGWNYLLRYFFAINSKPFVLLGGFEKANTRWQKILYKYVFRKAEAIICRDSISHQTVSMHVQQREKALLYEDFAIKIIQIARWNKEMKQVQSPYALVNLIEHRLDDAAREMMQQWYRNYKDTQNGEIVYFPCTNTDKKRHETLITRGVVSQLYNREEHTIEESLSLFAHADAVVWSRLHFLLPAQILDRPRLAISYAEKIDKLITSTIKL